MRKDGKLIICIGASRSGKSVYIKELLKLHKRAIIFDAKGEYTDIKSFNNRYDFLEYAKTCKNEHIAFRSFSKKDFDFFCAVTFVFNMQSPSLIICEELANVTQSGQAVGKWGRLVNQGLAFEPTIVGTVQRGQEVDKSILGNASIVHIAKQTTADDRNYIAKKFYIDEQKIPKEPLQFLHLTSEGGLILAGKIDFSNGKANFKGAKGVLTLLKNGEFKGFDYN